MAGRKKKKRVEKVEKLEENPKSNFGVFERLHLEKSYASLLLGAFVVVLISVLLVGFAKGRNVLEKNNPKPQTSSQKTEKMSPTPAAMSEEGKITGTTYTIKEDDLLFDIAVRAYGDGYRWPEIASANNLENPDVLTAGMVLKIPR